MTEVKILDTYWGTSKDEVEKSMEATGWQYDDGDSIMDKSIRYKGTLFQREVFLECNFTLTHPDTNHKLQKLEFVFFRPNDWLYNIVLDVLKEKYKEPIRGGFYNNAPTWIIDDGETAIQVICHPEDGQAARLCVIMSYNGEGAEDRKVDYFQEAMDKM